MTDDQHLRIRKKGDRTCTVSIIHLLATGDTVELQGGDRGKGGGCGGELALAGAWHY